MDLGKRVLALIAVSGLAALTACAPGKTDSLGGQPTAQPKESTAVQQPREVGDQTPGVPAVPVAQHETWPEPAGRNADRQLSVTSSNPSVKLPAALGQDLGAYWTQSITWHPCEGAEVQSAECATVKVPLDWENPGKAALDIAVTRVPSNQPKHGPLFLNPGGPGAGGTEMALGLAQAGEGGAEVFPGYDLVGWDPRGTGDSTHVECAPAQQDAALLETDSSPDNDEERKALEAAMAAYAKGCREASGELLDHVSTIETARDLDLLRFLLGAEKLNYYGTSYGTELGAMYAELFPENTGKLALDAAGNITDKMTVSQNEGFELALRNFAAWCAEKSNCSLGENVDQVMGNIDTFLKGLDSKPISVGDKTLAQSTGTTGVQSFLYMGAEGYPMLARAIETGIAGDGSELLNAAEEFLGVSDSGWDSSAAAFAAIDCLDRPDQGLAGAYSAHAEQVNKAPVMAGNSGPQLACQLWTTDSAPNIKRTGKGAAPILVIGGTGDAATPYQHAVDMANQLESATLLTYDGPGHGSFNRGNTCIDKAVGAYFEDGSLPVEGTVCRG